MAETGIFSNLMFPGLNMNNHGCKKEGIKVTSNLPLQMSLYFNVVFAPVWGIVILLFLDKNYHTYNDLYKYIIITVVCTVFIMEVVRLYLGYEGNLKIKIPELAGFWMVSILLQFPLQCLLLFHPYFKMYILEKVVQGIMLLMLSIQLIFGFHALKYTATEQAKYVQMKKQNQ
ncbi:unnamed protein product [Phaedon cochleariae]|uniref:Uncharacterized protein n=1 Tax=Phaedon cochleariae TaxID=80249 RepID=A0A9N9SAP0_PHACE|nr:unnamed protein product [Phaedon cochleariae]